MPELKNIPATHKVMARWPIIAEKLTKGETVPEIAKHFNLSIDTIYKSMQHPEFKEYMDSALTESFIPQFLKQAERIQELWESSDPRDRREALKEVGRAMRHSQGSRVYQRTENLNLNISQDRLEIRELLELATPQEQEVLINLFNRARARKVAPKIIEDTPHYFTEE